MAAARIRIVWPGGDTREARLRRFYVGSFVFHLLLATVLIFAPRLFGSEQPVSDRFLDVIHAQLVADIAEPLVQTPTPKPAQPKPEPEPEPEPTIKAPPPDDEPAAGDVKFSKRAAAKPKREKPKPPPVVEPEPTEAADSEAEAAEIVGDAAGGVQAGGEVSLFGWYQGAVSRALYTNWRRPVLAGLRDALGVRISFEIQRNGRVTGLHVVESSGVDALDRSALRAVADASPLPKLPPAWRESKMTAAYLFQLNPEDY